MGRPPQDSFHERCPSGESVSLNALVLMTAELLELSVALCKLFICRRIHAADLSTGRMTPRSL
jgi:hypothetical protein